MKVVVRKPKELSGFIVKGLVSGGGYNKRRVPGFVRKQGGKNNYFLILRSSATDGTVFKSKSEAVRAVAVMKQHYAYQIDDKESYPQRPEFTIIPAKQLLNVTYRARAKKSVIELEPIITTAEDEVQTPKQALYALAHDHISEARHTLRWTRETMKEARRMLREAKQGERRAARLERRGKQFEKVLSKFTAR